MIGFTGGDNLEKSANEASDTEEEYVEDSDESSLSSDGNESGDGYESDDTDELTSDDEQNEEDSDDEDDENDRIPVPKQIKINVDEYSVNLIKDICFHPKSYLLAASIDRGLRASYVELYQNKPNERNERLLKLKVSKTVGRAVSFSKDGNSLFSLNADKTLRAIDLRQGEISRTLHQTHSDNPHCLAVVDQNLLATGDEEGYVKVWDLRHQDGKPVMSQQTEKLTGATVNNIFVDDAGKYIWAVADNGCMATFNARQRKFIMETNKPSEFEFNCGSTIKENSKLVVGTGEGVLHLYNWSQYAAPSDSFSAAGGASIDSLARVSDSVVFTACDDGWIRATNVLPNRVISKVGQFTNSSPKRIVTSWDNQYVAACNNDVIKFFDVPHITNIEVSDRDKTSKAWKIEKKVNQHRGCNKIRKRKQISLEKNDPAKRQQRSEFFSTLDSVVEPPEAETDDESSSEDEDLPTTSLKC